MKFEEILTRFDVVSRKDSRALARCPCHDDKQASLSITRGRKGTLLHCHAGCDYRDIVAAVGLRPGDLFYDGRSPNSCTDNRYTPQDRFQWFLEHHSEARYDYQNWETGEITHVKFRYRDKKTQRKAFAQGHYQNNVYIDNLMGIDTSKSVYCGGKLDKVKQDIADGKLIFLPEWEKDVDTLIRGGYTAVTSGGATSWKNALAPFFRGAQVVVLQDNDQPGLDFANTIKQDLQGVAANVKIVNPCPDKPGGDISDYFQNHTKADFEKLLNATQTETVQEPERAAVDGQTEDSDSLVRKLITMDAYHNYGTDDISSARLFSDIFSETHRYNVSAKDWYCYNGKFWEIDREGLKARTSAKKLAKALTIYAVNHIPDADEKTKEAYLKYAFTWNYSRTRNSIIQDSRDLNVIKNEFLDTDDFGLNVQNGFLRFQNDGTVSFEPHKAGHLCSKIANAIYNPKAKCDRWEQFISEIMLSDNSKIRYLQKVSGLCLTGDTSNEKMWMLYGSTSRNGKTTLLESESRTLGMYAQTIRPESLATKNNPDSRNASPDIAKLAGVRLCITSEFPKRMNLDSGLLKNLTGGEKISARYLNQNEFEYYPKFKILCATNSLPTCQDDSVFKSNRIQIITFDRHFNESEQDKSLKAELSKPEALSGILSWMLQGWKMYCIEGLDAPEAVTAATQEYQNSNDKLQNFINDTMCPAQGKNISVKDIYAKYEEWCSENGYFTENKRHFVSDIKNKGLYADRGMVDGKQIRNIIKNHRFVDDSETDFVQVEQSEIPFD